MLSCNNKILKYLLEIKKIARKLYGTFTIGDYVHFYLFRRVAKDFIKESKCLIDVGCGDGFFVRYCSQFNPKAKIFAYDKKREAFDKEMEGRNIAAIEFFELDVIGPFPHSDVDFIFSVDVLEHIHNYQRVLQNIYVALKLGGILYIHVPTEYQRRIFKRFETWRNHDHVRSGFSMDDLKEALQQIGFQVVKSGYSFGYFGKLAWELDEMAGAIKVVKYLILPFLKCLVLLDTVIQKNDGNGMWIVSIKK